jgi:hypothetical protein
MPHFFITRRRRLGVRQLAAAFDCQFIANLAEMSASQWRKQSLRLQICPKYPPNKPRRQQAAALHGAPRAHLLKNYAALGVSPAKLFESMQLSFLIHAGETPAIPAASRMC